MTGVARLGLKTRILSTVGTDSLGDSVIAEFEADGISTEFLNRQEGAATPFTYIIVDESGTVPAISDDVETSNWHSILYAIHQGKLHATI